MSETNSQLQPDAIPPGGDTPAMRQYFRFKREHPDCILFFRMGDFYEMFFDDAKTAHKALGVTLTQRSAGVPMAGVPYHSVENYLRRMIQAGYRVAVCEQMEDPAQAKGLVKREVTRVVTPGTLTDESLLEEGRENPLAAIVFHTTSERDPELKASVAWTELSTGSFSLATFNVDELPDELARINPRELLYVETADGQMPTRIKSLTQPLGCAAAARPTWQFRQNQAVETLQRQFGVASLAGFGLGDDDPALGPAAAIIQYLLETQRAPHRPMGMPNGPVAGTPPVSSTGHPDDASISPRPPVLSHLQPPRRFSRSAHLIIDQTSLRSLEIERTLRSGGTDGTLLGTLQSCSTPMGKRTLRHWLCYPLHDKAAIQQRQRVVQSLVNDARFLDELGASLDGVQDVQRILGRIAVGRATPRDLVALGSSARQCRVIADLLAGRSTVADFAVGINSITPLLSEFASTVAGACVDQPPQHLREGGLIRDGYDAHLDESRTLQVDSNVWLAGYQKSLIEQTSIPNLKVGYNKVFGYYIELSAGQRDKAPANWTRKQTLKNNERFITPELKEYEGKVLTAKDRAIAREQELFAQLCDIAQKQLPHLQSFAQAVADLDVLACFARRAVRFRYVCPQIVDESVLHISAGRHPVLDELLGDQFVPNDIELGRAPTPQSALQPTGAATLSPSLPEIQAPIPPSTPVAAPRDSSPTLALITGPNMAGKSTYIRTAALLTLLAHTGSFVPADSATVGLTDRIFTRIGASDELHTGASTFMVEMTETANICHHATARSLVILDEIGRGTSTLDGLSLAWAIAEHIAIRECRALFATHYHELTALADRFDNVSNLSVTVREWNDQIVFLHRIARGVTDRSYGIHVAKIAGLPVSVVTRANELLSQLAVSHNASQSMTTTAAAAKTAETTKASRKQAQLSLFTEYLDHPLLEQVRKVDINQLSPLQAFEVLRKLRETADRG